MFRMSKIIVLSMFFLFSASPILAEQPDFITLHGFGSIGGAYQSNDNILYRNSLNSINGSRGDFSFSNGTLLGLQLDVMPMDKLTFTLQGVASDNNGNDEILKIEWANIKYQFNDSFDLRAGRMRLSAFMFSDTINVSYSYDWLSLPNMYSIVPFHSYQGIEANYTLVYSDFTIETKILFGEESDTLRIIDFVETDKTQDFDVDAENIFGAMVEVSGENLKLRFGYTILDFTIYNKAYSEIELYVQSSGIPLITETYNNFKIIDAPLSYLELGAVYDWRDAYVIGEYIKVFSDSFAADTTSWYIGGGYRFEAFTPFITYSKTWSKSNYEDMIIPSTAPPPIQFAAVSGNALFNNIANNNLISQETISIGLRYDVFENIALKVQYDLQKEYQDTSSTNIHFNGESQKYLNIFGLSLCFVF